MGWLIKSHKAKNRKLPNLHVSRDADTLKEMIDKMPFGTRVFIGLDGIIEEFLLPDNNPSLAEIAVDAAWERNR